MERYTEHLSDAANFSVKLWNCGGLSKLKKNMILQNNFDIMCLTETHEWRDDDPNSIYSEVPGANDKWSGANYYSTAE